jgi:carbon starvation protein
MRTTGPNSVLKHAAWIALAVLAAVSLGTIALRRGETISALWLVTAAVSVYLIAFRFYSRYIALHALRIDGRRATPAWRRNDGLDFVPTERSVLFGHHFAAIAGAGPLVGPVLAAQMGYLPGTLWIIVGVVFAGAVQDMLVLFFSTRRDGRSLGEMIRSEMGAAAGVTAMIGILMIMVILLAVLSLVVVRALAQSPWGTFTVAMTIPIAVVMGLYLRVFRPGRILEVSLLGLGLLLLSIWFGGRVAMDPVWGPAFTLRDTTLAWLLIAYGFVAAVLPVWLLLAPRDYLSTFLKVGTVVLLAVAILIARPDLQMPPLTRFVDGTGPVFAGQLFPFLFITIACGAVSGFHALVSSGTTPKMIADERHIPLIGYGAMLMESFVAVMALIAACVLQPGVYFAMNSPPALIGTTVESAAAVIANWGFVITPDVLASTAQQIGEHTILSRTGGAPTLAVGMAQILNDLIGGSGMLAFWYHYAILFEALFILTTLDAGTRVARFMIQDLVGVAYAPFRRTESWTANVVCTAYRCRRLGLVSLPGRDRSAGRDQHAVAAVRHRQPDARGHRAHVLLRGAGQDEARAVPVDPAAADELAPGLHAHRRLAEAVPSGPEDRLPRERRAVLRRGLPGEVLGPATSLAEMQRVAFNNTLDAGLCALFIIVLLATVCFGVKAALAARRSQSPTSQESEHVALESLAR